MTDRYPDAASRCGRSGSLSSARAILVPSVPVVMPTAPAVSRRVKPSSRMSSTVLSLSESGSGAVRTVRLDSFVAGSNVTNSPGSGAAVDPPTRTPARAAVLLRCARTGPPVS